MEKVIYGNLQREGLELVKRNSRYYIRYDAGAHQVAWREDELSELEAAKLQLGSKEEREVIISLQEKILQNGGKPNVQNWSPVDDNS